MPSFSCDSILMGGDLLTITGGGLFVNNVSQTGAAAQQSTLVMSGNLIQTGVILTNRDNYLDSVSLRITGNQFVTGQKVFNLGAGSGFLIKNERGNDILKITAGGVTTINGTTGQPFIDNSIGFLYNPSDLAAAIDLGSRDLYDSNSLRTLRWNDSTLRSGSTVHANWKRRQLSGDWSTNTVPTESGHIINKGFLNQKNILNATYNKTNLSTGENFNPTGLVFNLQRVGRPFSLISECGKEFESHGALAYAETNFYNAENGIISAGNSGVFDATCVGGFCRFRSISGPINAWWSTEIEVASIPTGNGITILGVSKDANNRITPYYDGSNLNLDITISGIQTLLPGSPLSISPPYKLNCSMTERIVSVFYDLGRGWTLGSSWNISSLGDYTPYFALKDFKYTFGFAGIGVGKIYGQKAGVFGSIGISSQYVVSYEDGTPIWDGRNLYLCCASAGLDSENTVQYRGAHTSVYKWNVDTDSLSEQSHLFTSRNSKFLADSYGPLIYDRDDEIWRLFVQNTTTFLLGSQVTYQFTSKSSLLNGVHILSGAQQVMLPNSGCDYWDADFRKISGKWYSAYSIRTPDLLKFYPAMASGDLTNWNLINTDSGAAYDTSHGVEGARLQKFGNTWYSLFGRNGEILVYDINLKNSGSLIPNNWVSTISPAHPTLVPIPTNNGNTQWKIQTFDAQTMSGMQTSYGNWVTYIAPETKSGYPFDYIHNSF